MIVKKYLLISLLLCFVSGLAAQRDTLPGELPATPTPKIEDEPLVPLPVKQLLRAPYMRGATLALGVREVETGRMVYACRPETEVTPASVMKTVTTAAALELLGEGYVFPTTLEYDGKIVNGVLEGNLYIRGSGDPTLGSRHVEGKPTDFLLPWFRAVQAAGIRAIRGAVIADEGCFDSEGTGWKWVNEDLGSYYGAGSYGINVFDNNYRLILRTGAAGSRPEVVKTEPKMNLTFHNHLECSAAREAEYYISGAPFSRERYIYGVVPPGKEAYVLKGDIPDPALYLADYFTAYLKKQGIGVRQPPSCRRIREREGTWKGSERTEIVTTSSPPLRRIVRIVNEVSQNLYADVLLKTLGNRFVPADSEARNSFEKGTDAVTACWKERGLDVSSLWMYDGSGLAVTDKLTAAFLTDLLVYMRREGASGDAFYESLPLAGREGSVRNFLKGTSLEGRARLKSGSMSRVKSYAGYVKCGEKKYAVVLVVNNYACEGREMTKAIEQLLTALL